MNVSRKRQSAPLARWLSASALAFCLIMSGAVSAQSASSKSQSGISSGQAANIARSATGGKVLSVSPAGNTFKVKVLKGNGVVTNVRVDRSSGKVRR